MSPWRLTMLLRGIATLERKLPSSAGSYAVSVIVCTPLPPSSMILLLLNTAPSSSLCKLRVSPSITRRYTTCPSTMFVGGSLGIVVLNLNGAPVDC